jgi:hypothetical protein
LVGIEEAGARQEQEMEQRLGTWVSRGSKDLEDAPSFFPASGNDAWHGERAVLQPTWEQLIRMLLVAWGDPDWGDAVLGYQRQRLGAADGETCLVELLPLPSPSTQVWNYGQWSRLPWLSHRAGYMAAIRNRRVDALRQRVGAYKPKALVFYGTTLAGGVSVLPSWSYIAGGRFEQAVAGSRTFLERHDGQTAFFVSKHPADPGIRSFRNDYFRGIGKVLSERLGDGFRRLCAH